MQLSRPARSDAGDGHLIPLINVVFLLLIFFMLAGTFRAPEPIEVVAPAASGQDPAALDLRVWVYVGQGGLLAIDQKLIRLDELTDELAARAGGAALGSVYLKVDERVPVERLFAVVDAIKPANPASIELITRFGGRAR